MATVWAALASAEPAPFYHLQPYTLEHGLSQNSVTALAEDDLGLWWIGTQDGLNRFDGQRFHVLREQGDGEPGLVSGSIEVLAVDARSRLWIGTNESGLEVIDLRGGTSRRLGPAEGVSHPLVRTLLLDGSGGAWLGTGAGIDHVDADLARVRTLLASDPVVALHAVGGGPAFALDQRCRLWALGPERAHALPAVLPSAARCLALAGNGRSLWLATVDHGLFELALDGRLLQTLAPSQLRAEPVAPSALLVDADGSVLLGFDDGALFGGDAEHWQRIELDRPLGSAITALARHRSGVLWIGTYTTGLFRAQPQSAAVRRDVIADTDIAAWPSRSVRSFHVHDAQLHVGTDAGLVVREAPSRPFRPVDLPLPTQVRAMLHDRDGLWIGTQRGLWWRDRHGRFHERPLPDPRVTDMLLEGERLWVTTRGGLAVFERGEPVAEAVPPPLAGQFLTTLRRDDLGRMWIASNDNGVFRIDADGGIEHLHPRHGTLPHASVWALHFDDRAWWLGSFAGGLIRIDRDSGDIRSYTRRDGLADNIVYRIVADPQGRLWLSGNSGLSVFDPATARVRTLLPGDGLRNREYNSGAGSAIGALLYFGGTEGVDVIEPARLEADTPTATPLLTTLRVLGGGRPGAPPAAPVAIGYEDRIVLSHRQRIVSIDMVALDFTAPDAARLRYRLRGVHEDWLEPQGGHAELLLSYLPSGQYHLEVQAAGRDGRFGDSRVLALAMRPAPWEHPLALAGYALLALGLALWMLSRIGARERAKRAQIALLNRTVETRTAELEFANRLLQRSNEQLQLATRTDPLTQASNRRDLQEWLLRETAQLVELAGVAGVPPRSLLFMMVDIDDFKRINDSHGHQVGDEVLVAFADRLRMLCRDRDMLVRWGGEEFLLLLRDSDVDDAMHVAERVRRAIADAPVALRSGQSLPVTCSIGFAPWPLSPAWPTLGDWEQSVNLADRALYAAKAAGKNAWVGLAAGATAERGCLLQLLAGVAPERLQPGCVAVLHSTAAPPRFVRD